MTRRALILVSDSTSHGGGALDGADARTLDGRAIACVGRKVSCPERKGDFPIVPDGSGRRVLPWIGGRTRRWGPGAVGRNALPTTCASCAVRAWPGAPTRSEAWSHSRYR